MKHRTEITFETEETVLLRQGHASITEYCSFCGAIRILVTPEAMTTLTGLSEREIFRRIETGQVHFTERDRIFVCANSLKEKKEL